MKPRGPHRALAVAAALAIGSCGGDEPEFDELPNGAASGPGFEFKLPDGWAGASDREELLNLITEVADDFDEIPPGLDFGTGFSFGGFWIDPGAQEQRPTVNVLIEPLTIDTSLAVAVARSNELIGDLASSDEAVDQRPIRIDGRRGLRTEYSLEGGEIEIRGFTIRRGSVAYTLTVRMEGASDHEIDEFIETLISNWRWRPLGASDREEFASLREFSGSGYSVVLPSGWRATGAEELEETSQEASGIQQQLFASLDSLWRGFVGKRNSTNVQVRVNPAPTLDVDRATDIVEREERSIALREPDSRLRIERGDHLVLDGEPARVLLLDGRAGNVRSRVTEVVVLHNDMIYTLTYFAVNRRYEADQEAFLDALASWRWE